MFNDLTDILEAYALEMEVCSEAESQMERYLRKSEASDLALPTPWPTKFRGREVWGGYSSGRHHGSIGGCGQ